jgi:hypothetical protein
MNGIQSAIIYIIFGFIISLLLINYKVLDKLNVLEQIITKECSYYKDDPTI